MNNTHVGEFTLRSLMAIRGKTIERADIVPAERTSPVSTAKYHTQELVLRFTDGTRARVHIGGSYGMIDEPIDLDLMVTTDE